MKRATFRVTEYSYHGRKRWRLRIPARFSSTGKEVALYYTTKQEAERDAVTLRAKHSGGSLLAADLLAPDAVRDARAALAKLAAAGSHMSLTDAVTLDISEAQALIPEGWVLWLGPRSLRLVPVSGMILIVR